MKTALTNNAGCDAIPRNGDYSLILGTLSDGSGQAFYMSYVELDENTVENPIPDAGTFVFGGSAERALMPGFYCPVAAKSFMNSKF